MTQKKIGKRAWGFASNSQNLNKSLKEVYGYIVKKQWLKAEKTIQELEEHFSSTKEICECWLMLASEQGDWQSYQQKATEYTLKHPDEPYSYLTLSSGCLQNEYPFLALEALQNFCKKFPHHAEIPNAKERIKKIEMILPTLLQEYDIGEQNLLEIGILHERGRFLFQSNQYAEASKIFEDLINISPKFAPAFNNLSLIRCFEGDLTGAIALAKQVIEFAPDNFQALGNLVRFYLLSGKNKLAQKYLNQFKALELDTNIPEIWIKKAESLALFGDWSGLVELGKKAESPDISEDLNALFWHCVAVGYANVGQNQKARQLWEKALKIAPGFEYAQKNLANIKLPPSERTTPWAFDMQDWLSSKIKNDIFQMLSDLQNENKSNKSKSIAQKIVENNPHIVNIIPILLKRSSPVGREFAIYIATLTKKPELIAALKEFAFGREGSDKERLKVAQELNQEGLIPSGHIKIWLKGEEQEVLLMAMEINDEPTVKHSKKVLELSQKSVMLLKMGNSKEAESVLKKALEIEPSAPDLKFNLANAYFLQDRKEEASDLLLKIHEESPDYAFATVVLARQCIENEELDMAEELLTPLLQKRKFNFQEMLKLCETQIELAVKRKNIGAAKSWLNMWKEIGDENDENLKYWSKRLQGKSSSLFLK